MKLAGLGLALVLACSSGTAQISPKIAVVSGELILRGYDGRVLRTAELIGSIVTTSRYAVRMNGAKQDEDSIGGEIWLYQLTVLSPEGSESAFCATDSHGDGWALPFEDENGDVSFACTSGAIGKCIRLGYPPAGDVSRGDLHRACIRMVRADYGGDGTSFTREGTLVGFCDNVGIHRCTTIPPIEAAWFAGGAQCVAHPRVAELVTLEGLERRFPRLRGRLGENCTVASARADARVVIFSWLPQPSGR